MGTGLFRTNCGQTLAREGEKTGKADDPLPDLSAGSPSLWQRKNFSHSTIRLSLLFSMMMSFSRSFLLLCWVCSLAFVVVVAKDVVVVETISPGDGPPVTKDHRYKSMVTLYIENKDKSKTPSGWSTRKEDGADEDTPFEFQPGVQLIQGWTQGVLQMKEGERAWLHVPSSLGYGPRPMGRPGGAFYIPGNSDLLFDIEILGKVGVAEEL